MQASMIFGAGGTGWFLASTYWVSHSLIVESPSLWVLAPFMALALALILAFFGPARQWFHGHLGGDRWRACFGLLPFSALANGRVALWQPDFRGI
jgi:apolipoprotein N-acyltransferase